MHLIALVGYWKLWDREVVILYFRSLGSVYLDLDNIDVIFARIPE